MNKAELVKIVAAKAGVTGKQADAVINSVFEAIKDELAAGGKFQVVGFGTFKVKQRAERSGFNPKTKEKLTIPASNVPAFVPGKALKDVIK